MAKSVPLSRIQRIIGKRMLASKREKPCFYLQIEADISKMMKLRSKTRKKVGFKVTSNSFILYAVSLAAEEWPLVIAKLEGEDTVRIPDAVNMGFAVNAPQGLVVPVIKRANEIGLVGLSREEKLLTEKARSNKLDLDDLSDLNISVSNLGPYNIDSFYGIMPPGDTSIITVGNITRKYVVRDGEIDTAKVINICMAVDHRVVNGDYAARFLGRVKKLLEKPEELL